MRENFLKRLDKLKIKISEFKTKKMELNTEDAINDLNRLTDELNRLTDELIILDAKRLIDREFSKYTIEDKQNEIDEYFKI